MPPPNVPRESFGENPSVSAATPDTLSAVETVNVVSEDTNMEPHETGPVALDISGPNSGAV